MVNIPKEVLDVMADPATAKLLITANKKGVPHAIVAGSIGSPTPDKMIVGEVMMKKSSANLKENAVAEFVVVNGPKAYSIQVKAIARMEAGPEVDMMNQRLATMKLKAAAVWAFEVLSVHDQSAAPTAGTKLA